MRPLITIVERYTEKRNTQRFWKRISRAVALITILVTVYALMLPAVTSEQFVTANDNGDVTIWISNTNYYEPNKVILIDGYTVAEFNDSNYNNTFEAGGAIVDMNAAAKASFVENQPTFVGYTAVIIEYLNNGQGTGVQYYVDAVITSTESTILNPNVTMTNLTPKTHNGFIVYIPNSFLTEANTPRRGDLVTPNFWHWHPDVIVGYNSDDHNKVVGTLTMTENPTDSNVLATTQSTPINATVKIFDYNSTVNNLGNEFLFWNGAYGNGASVESVDGWGSEIIQVNGEYVYSNPYSSSPNISEEAHHGYNKNPIMTGILSAGGYPQLSDQTPGKEGNPVDLDYLFNGTYQQGGTMTDGGGLFQQDANGYYYYDSGQNYAYYDKNINRFILYKNLIARPWADSNDTSNQAYGNFLPLNPVNTGNVTLDGYYFVDNTITTPEAGQYGGTHWPGSLYEGAGQDIYSALATLDKNGNNRLKQEVWSQLVNQGKYSARLEDKVNLWFGMSVEFAFYQPVGGMVNDENMVFEFNGDDDVWVYVGVWNTHTMSYDYKLVLDIGGAHEARDGFIDFATGAVTYENVNGETVHKTLQEIFDLSDETFSDYSKLSLKFFYLERGGNISYCKLRFNIPTVPDKSLTVTKQLDFDVADTVLKDYIADAYDYQFRVMEADESGNLTGNVLIKEGTSYTIFENGVAIGVGTVGKDGIFQLKAGQSAQFADMLQAYGGCNYVVQELFNPDLQGYNPETGQYEGQYSNVQYTIGGGTNTQTNVDAAVSEDFITFSTNALSTRQFESVIYRNTVKTSKLANLEITKQVATGTTIDAATRFPIRVTLGGEPIPVGATYLVGGEERVVTAVGILELAVGETARIEGILAGTQYTVQEEMVTGYFPTYSGITSGAFGVQETVTIVITNADYAQSVQVPINKTYLGNSGTATFEFIVEQVLTDGTHVAHLEGCNITVTDDQQTAGTIYLKYSASIADGTYYYRIYEKVGSLNARYDDTVYLVEVTVTNQVAAITKVDGNTYTGAALAFVNHKLTDVTVQKTVSGNTPPENMEFSFTAQVLWNGEVYLPDSGSGYTVGADGTITFALTMNETVTLRGIPVGAVVTVAEPPVQHYLTSFIVGDSTVSGNAVSVTAVETGVMVTCNNEGLYVLPTTGGPGTIWYTLTGGILMAVSLACLVYIYLKRRREAN